jgi:hypothetical protein
MSDFTAGDIIFVVFILGVIHGIMLIVGYLRRRKSADNASGKSPSRKP